MAHSMATVAATQKLHLCHLFNLYAIVLFFSAELSFVKMAEQVDTCGPSLRIPTVVQTMPPLMIFNSSGNASDPVPFGSFYDLVTSVVKACCPNGSALDIVETRCNLHDLETQLVDEVFAFPVSRNLIDLAAEPTSGDLVFLPAVTVQGPVVVVPGVTSNYIVLQSITGSWPLLLTVFISAAIAAIIIWIIERLHNPDHFPKPFLKGFWESLWWAFVTMTTVGYGDKTPRSIPGRIFGLIWIIVGVVLMSVLTATLTTTIGSDTSYYSQIRGYRVGVLNLSQEHLTAISMGATPIDFSAPLPMIEAVQKGTVSLGLLNLFRAINLVDMVESNSLQLANTLEFPVSYGILVQNLPDTTVTCFRRSLVNNKFKVYQDSSEGIRENVVMHSVTATELLESGLVGVYAAICVWLVLFLILAAWDCWKHRPCSRPHKISGSAKETPNGNVIKVEQVT